MSKKDLELDKLLDTLITVSEMALSLAKGVKKLIKLFRKKTKQTKIKTI